MTFSQRNRKILQKLQRILVWKFVIIVPLSKFDLADNSVEFFQKQIAAWLINVGLDQFLTLYVKEHSDCQKQNCCVSNYLHGSYLYC